jgi:hypothetical protein
MNNSIDNSIKIKLSLYGLISALSCIFLLMTVMPGISVPIFVIIQFISICLIIKDRREIKNKNGILIMIPIFILSLNRYISGSILWRNTNLFVIILLYSVMILIMEEKLNLKNGILESIIKVISKSLEPFLNYSIPVRWHILSKEKERKSLLVKRVLLAIVISVPCVLFILIMLSSSDMIFSGKVNSIFKWLFDLINFSYIIELFYVIFVGLYLFGLLYSIFDENALAKKINDLSSGNGKNFKKRVQGDLIVFNILLVSLLIVYSFFVIIQFKYLFSGAQLPYGLNYSDYARRGFFELVFLSVVNMGLIVITI